MRASFFRTSSCSANRLRCEPITGVQSSSAKPSETRRDDVRRVFEVNVFAAVAVTNAMLPLLRRASPAARIVMVSSEIGGLSNHGDSQWKYAWFNADFAEILFDGSNTNIFCTIKTTPQAPETYPHLQPDLSSSRFHSSKTAQRSQHVLTARRSSPTALSPGTARDRSCGLHCGNSCQSRCWLTPGHVVSFGVPSSLHAVPKRYQVRNRINTLPCIRILTSHNHSNIPIYRPSSAST